MSIFFADIGNSAIKLFKKNGTLFLFNYYENESRLNDFFMSDNPEKILVSSVCKKGLLLLENACKLSGEHGSKIEIIQVSNKSPYSFKIHMDNPETIGVDRLIDLEAGISLGIDTSFVVVDSGSAITIDLIEKKNDNFIFSGGFIIPGKYSQQNILMGNTEIPYTEHQIKGKRFPGRNTKQSINNGIEYCLVYGVKGILKKFRQDFKIKSVIFTGGDGRFLFDEIISLSGDYPGVELIFKENLAFYGLQSIEKKMKIV